MSHTQGPWDSQGVFVVALGSDVVIAKMAFGGTSKPDMETALANARLIAAAPDLLAALKHLAVLLEPALNSGQACVPGLATVNAAWLAIAKAEGK